MPAMTAAAAAFLVPLAIEGVKAGSKMVANRKTDLDRRNEERIEALKRREEMGALGLTDAEEAMMRQQAESSRSAAQRSLEAERRAAQAAFGTGSGAALATNLAAEQGEMAGQQNIGNTIAAADLEEKDAEMDELEQLIAVNSNREMQRRAVRQEGLSNMGDVVTNEMLFRRETGQGAQGPDAETGAAAKARTERPPKTDESASERLRYKGQLLEAGFSEAEAEAALVYIEENGHLSRPPPGPIRRGEL